MRGARHARRRRRNKKLLSLLDDANAALLQQAEKDYGRAAACHWAFHHDPDSAEAEVWSLLEAKRTLAELGFFEGLRRRS